jgi:hypothetical protein
MLDLERSAWFFERNNLKHRCNRKLPEFGPICYQKGWGFVGCLVWRVSCERNSLAYWPAFPTCLRFFCFLTKWESRFRSCCPEKRSRPDRSCRCFRSARRRFGCAISRGVLKTRKKETLWNVIKLFCKQLLSWKIHLSCWMKIQF